MFEERLILSVIVISLGFIIFLLSNLQKSILTKILGWLVSVVVTILGITFFAKTVFFKAVKETKIGETAGQKIYKKAGIDKIFDEVDKAWKEK